MASNRSERVRNRYGICLNDSCSKCKGKEVQEVPARKDFVCAECGKPLRECPPPRSWWDKHGKKVIGGIVVALLAAGGACVALLGGGETTPPTPSAPPTPQVETPVISPESGEYKNDVKVTLDCATDSVNIYYTLNGEEPSDVSALYSEPIQIDKTTTIKVIACRPGYINSNVSVAEFTISKGKTPNPTGVGSGKRYKGTLNLGYGRYSGDIVDGKPDGAGVLTYTKQQKVVSTKDVVAEPGERIEGVFENGKASFVTLYRKDGNTVKVHR
ncbi:MAG: chitobiase/beta-hexosaminidase C-terminal domain-containing protein [Bacteroidaceae bacterium]|nr:chitobiase/beta-hexosaminidase C-terminal domain-containing protein [Bacteroidaceae bacterium]